MSKTLQDASPFMHNMTFKIELTEPELNVILQSLAQMPYLHVVELINKIHAQVKTQLPEAPQ